MGVTRAHPQYAIAIDGGGGKTDALAVDASGAVLARARAGGSSPQILGLDRALGVVDGLVGALIAQLGAAPVRVHCYLSGVDLPEEYAAFRAAAAAASWAPADAEALVIENDLFALLRAGTDEPDAAAVVCGTGINAIGVRRDGRVVRFPALGAISGDWGGGWQLGEQALWHAARAVDGRGPETVLTGAVPVALGLGSVDDVIRALHFGRLPMAALSAVAPAVFAAASEGDAVAAGLVDRQAEEIVALAAAALRRLDLLGARVPVVLGGGVVAGGDERLMRGIRQGLAEHAPHARPVVVDAPPVVGAALLAAAALGAAPDALGRLASALSPASAAAV
ncbi:MAG: N-acetylglucosamine kinase [Microbacterium sp.]|nr:N-acetylglucosamine kinase [Microbacterium sp.]